MPSPLASSASLEAIEISSKNNAVPSTVSASMFHTWATKNHVMMIKILLFFG